jgi:GNAT superfamily N-acetyltransferase
VSDLDIRLSRYDDADARQLIEQVQQEYVRRYGGPDATPVDPNEFADPHGQFFVGYLADLPVAMGGWRRTTEEAGAIDSAPGSAEIKRMYVVESARGRGYARAMLDHLEDSARAAGLEWLLLETGSKQPEAIQLYRSSGYLEVPAFGHYASAPLSVHLGKRISAEVLSRKPGVGGHHVSRASSD